MKQAAKKQLLNAQKVDGAIISEENGTIAFRKAPWNDTEVICEQPKVIPGRMVCSGEKGGDEFDFKPYERTGEKLSRKSSRPSMPWCAPPSARYR